MDAPRSQLASTLGCVHQMTKEAELSGDFHVRGSIFGPNIGPAIGGGMKFRIGDTVVHPVYGVGQISKIETLEFFETDERLYYEITIQGGTVWVPIADGEAIGLRAVIQKEELESYRECLKSPARPLDRDFRKRKIQINERISLATFLGLCEIVRDLTAFGWNRALNEADLGALRRMHDRLCQEWAASTGMTIEQAIQEIDTLLLESRQASHVKPQKNPGI